MLQLRFVDQDKPPVWLVENQYILGSAAGCHPRISGAEVRARHAELSVSDERLTVSPLAADAAVAVDGIAVRQPTPLRHNSMLDLGGVKLLVVDPKQQVLPMASPAAVSSPQVGWYLLSKTTALANKRFTIAGTVVLGRAKECDISLGVAHLSRKHARLVVENGELWVEDLGSSNGTFLNGERVDRARLHHGDELGFDTLVFSVFGESAAAMEDNGDKTSLRPALRMEPPVSSPSHSKPTQVAQPVVSKTDAKTRPVSSPLSAGTSAGTKIDSSAEVGSNVPLWLGIVCVGLLTAVAILYVLS